MGPLFVSLFFVSGESGRYAAVEVAYRRLPLVISVD